MRRHHSRLQWLGLREGRTRSPSAQEVLEAAERERSIIAVWFAIKKREAILIGTAYLDDVHPYNGMPIYIAIKMKM